MEDLYRRTFVDSTSGMDYPLSTPFGHLAVYGVHFFGAMVQQGLIVVFCISQKPLLCPCLSAATRGQSRQGQQPQLLRWLWRTNRAHLFASALMSYLMCLVCLIVGLIYREAAYPSEVQRSGSHRAQPPVQGLTKGPTPCTSVHTVPALSTMVPWTLLTVTGGLWPVPCVCYRCSGRPVSTF